MKMSLLFPSYSERKHVYDYIRSERFSEFFNCTIQDKSVCLYYYNSYYYVMAFGFIPVHVECKRARLDDWYAVNRFREYTDALPLFNTLVYEILQFQDEVPF